jgi:DNA-binding beta-propeller fold protein YncE
MNKKLITCIMVLLFVGSVAADDVLSIGELAKDILSIDETSVGKVSSIDSLFFNELVKDVFNRSVLPVKPYAAKRFISLPDDLKYPEGITSNPNNGDIYVGTFNVPNPAYNPTPVNAVLRYSKRGRLLARTDFSGITPLVGLTYNDNYIYIASLGDISGVGSKILRIAADFSDGDAAEFVADIPFIGTPQDRTVLNIDNSTDTISFNTNIRVPNDIIFNENGDLFVSDSFQGAIFRMNDASHCEAHCVMGVLAHDSLLATAGFPSFGANGIAFNNDESELFIANTGDDRILKLDMSGSGHISIFAESVNGPDGIEFDKSGNLWVTANQADNVIGLNSEGRIIAKLGDFLGVRKDGSARGLLFPGSLEIINNKIYVTNLAQVATPAVGDEPEETVTRYTVSKIRIPKL